MKTFLALFSALTLFALSAVADSAPPPSVNTQLDVLLDAIQANDIAKFHSVCDQEMIKAMTPETLKKVSTQIAGPLKAGYDKQYWGMLNRPSGNHAYYWKLHFSSKPDHDLLAEMWIVDGKVAGFYLR
ncbi:hypothetical protein [Cerasicoccus arenae]|uniref:DUF3887 domain-containing protein n=2 Tax=Cerasicoccus arenae TaxID=424488 RepID=A0A8J3DI93_9BACT|nr:hypothetical protein [Cerasicoccus arenae]GHC03914.1 hypothetical protein GCM10007047_20650 [Cerasicoccus arenae]